MAARSIDSKPKQLRPPDDVVEFVTFFLFSSLLFSFFFSSRIGGLFPMRRGGLACLQRISLARGAVEASPLAGCPASVLQRGGCSYATSSTSLLSEESSKRRPHHHSQARAEPPRRRRFDAVLLDATGTLISPSEPAAEVKNAMKWRNESDSRREADEASIFFFYNGSDDSKEDFLPLSIFQPQNNSPRPLVFLLPSPLSRHSPRSTATTPRSTASTPRRSA